MIVLAICPVQRVHYAEPFHQQENVLCFDIAEYRMWLAGYVGEIGEDGRYITSLTRSTVRVAPLTSELWHGSSERLSDYYDEDAFAVPS